MTISRTIISITIEKIQHFSKRSPKAVTNKRQKYSKVRGCPIPKKVILMSEVFCQRFFVLKDFCHTSQKNIPITSFTKLSKIHNKKLSIVKSVPVNWQGMENIFGAKTFLQRSFLYIYSSIEGFPTQNKLQCFIYFGLKTDKCPLTGG